MKSTCKEASNTLTDKVAFTSYNKYLSYFRGTIGLTTFYLCVIGLLCFNSILNGFKFVKFHSINSFYILFIGANLFPLTQFHSSFIFKCIVQIINKHDLVYYSDLNLASPILLSSWKYMINKPKCVERFGLFTKRNPPYIYQCIKWELPETVLAVSAYVFY